MIELVEWLLRLLAYAVIAAGSKLDVVSEEVVNVIVGSKGTVMIVGRRR